ncbi:hypothetical protein N7486_001096 [Penicillium sp. IBT 16267x]|nr:hypothetical protein N7486_001096 [Penicillium sp. IBT 16267x]
MSRVKDLEEGVYATDSRSPALSSQLFYGPSSNFFLLRRIHQNLGPTLGLTESFPVLPEEELDRFGRYINRSVPSQVSPDLYQKDQIMVKRSLLTSLLPQELAKKFMDRFLATEHPFLPFIDVLWMQQSVKVAYLDLDSSAAGLSEYIRLIAYLALGATLTEHLFWAESLFSQVQELFAALDEILQLGRPNSAYLIVGTASRKAIAAGLHREVPTYVTGSEEYAQQRILTFWSLCVFDDMVCYCLGRPHSIDENAISIQIPEHSFIVKMVKLTKIIRKSARNLYGGQNHTLFDLWKASHKIREELNRFEASLPEGLRIKSDNGSVITCCQSVAHFLLGNG